MTRSTRLLMRFLCVIVAALLAACAHVPGPEEAVAVATGWQVGGRFAAGQTSIDGGAENDPVAGRFAWQHENDRDVLWLIGPLGNTLARIEMTPQGVRWQDAAGKRGEATNLRALGESLSGLSLPDVPADRWLHGQWPAAEVRERDGRKRVQAAAAYGWQFVYRYGAPAPTAWPLAIEAAGPDGLWLRLALTEWNGVSDPAEQPAP